MKVLLVEDDDFFAAVMRGALEAATPSVDLERSASLAEAVARLSTDRFDAVLLDLTLPDSVGFPTVERIRQECPGLPSSC